MNDERTTRVAELRREGDSMRVIARKLGLTVTQVEAAIVRAEHLGLMDERPAAPKAA